MVGLRVDFVEQLMRPKIILEEEKEQVSERSETAGSNKKSGDSDRPVAIVDGRE
jgi:hypothetical protein